MVKKWFPKWLLSYIIIYIYIYILQLSKIIMVEKWFPQRLHPRDLENPNTRSFVAAGYLKSD